MKITARIGLLMVCAVLMFTLLLSGCNIEGFQPLETTSGLGETTPQESNPVDDLYKLEMQTVFEMARNAGYTGTLEELIAMFKGEQGPAGRDGVTPHIGTNGNWWVGATDLGVAAKGPKGEDGRGILKVEVINGYLWITYTDDPKNPVNVGSVSSKDFGVEHNFTNWFAIKDSTCSEGGVKQRYCLDCGYTESQMITGGHVEVVDYGVPATCSSTGLTEGKHCSVCGMVFVAQEVIPALAHNTVIKPAVDPTCVEEGFTQGIYCGTCGKVFTEQAVIPALGHSFSEWIIVKEATEMVAGLMERICSACGAKESKSYTLSASYKRDGYNTTTAVMPSNWNELTYADNNDTQILDYIKSSFFEYDYKFEGGKYNADGSINVDGIVADAYTVNYSAATKLEDVTSLVDAKWGYTASQKEEGGYAWKITLRDDLKWDDGTPITAADFVYSMQAQLDPAFMNFRGNTYYDTLMIKNSRNYFFQNQEVYYETIASFGYESNAAAVAAGEILYMDAWNFWGAKGYLDENGNTCPQWLAMNDETVYTNAEWNDSFSGKYLWDTYFNPETGIYAGYVEVGGAYEYWLSLEVINKECDVAWEDVGIYSIDDENAIVICFDKAYDFLKEDGSLSYQAVYYMPELPLVKKDLYESCKIAPKQGETLWTTNYNTSLETTASWGPYKLVRYEKNSDYRLELNPYWYGWNMEEYKNQYNVTAINCSKVGEYTTRWMGFLAGIYDDATLDSYNTSDYYQSKYINYIPGTGIFGMQLYSNLPVLKTSGNNNGILAIREFRQAFNLALSRADIVEKIWPGTSTPCFGLVNSEYYYDVENAPLLPDGGSYRNTVQAKEALLRAYGYVQAQDGSWSINGVSGLTLDEAHDSLTGYNLTLAKEKLNEAIAELMANADFYGYDASKNITLVYGSSVDTQKQRDRAQYLQDILDNLTQGTALEGKIDVVFDASAGSEWATAFRNGYTQIGFGYGFSGNAFDPFDIIGAYVDPDADLNYHQYWDTSEIDMTITLPAGDYAGAGQTITMSVPNWYFCLNGLAEANNQKKTYNWDAGYAPTEVRLMILAALEEIALKESYSIMIISEYDGSFLGAKFSYITDEYNTFMGFGGFRYMVVNYTHEEWEEFVAANNNDLSKLYKQTN